MSQREITQKFDQIKILQREIVRLTEQTYPVGSVVTVRLGVHLVTGPVVGHSDVYWSRPGEFYVKNERTGKTRSVTSYDMRAMAREQGHE